MPAKERPLDPVDIRILEILQTNARTTASDIAATVGMSVPAVCERLRRLESTNVIEQYTAVLNGKKLGKGIMALMMVTLEVPSPANYEMFRELVLAEQDILECYAVTGKYDYKIKIVTSSTASLEGLVLRVKAVSGGAKTNTCIVMSTVKSSSPVVLT